MRRLLLAVTMPLVAIVLVLPGAASASPLNGLTITPGVVNNGQSATGDLQLAFADPSPTTVLLFSSAPSAASSGADPTVFVPLSVVS